MRRPGPESVTWRIAGERLLVLGWGRAILLQMAHPLIAAGVDRHSTFRHGMFAPYRRLHATVSAMRALTFGSHAEAQAMADHIRRVHDRVSGELPEAAPGWPRGTAYSAHMPDLLAWVHLTLVDSMLRSYEGLVEPIPPHARDQYCSESRVAGRWFGIPDAMLPADGAALDAAFTAMVRSGRLQVTHAARRIARDLLDPPLGWATGPLRPLVRRLSVGWLPPEIREAYGFTWTERDEARLARNIARVRRLRARTPSRLARWPEARNVPPWPDAPALVDERRDQSA
ncbi:MAG TPA: oxygenase MpaB family protein [Vicinamibacterales bacterium]